MSAPSTPTADAGKDAWSNYNAGSRRGKVSNRECCRPKPRPHEASSAKTKTKNKKTRDSKLLPLSPPPPSSVLFQNPNSRGQAGRDREAEAARKGEQVPQKDHENHPGVVARQRRRRHFVVAVVEGQVQACAPGVRGRRRDRRIWWWRRELPCLCFCRWPSGGREEGMREKDGEEPPRAGRRRLSCAFLFFRCRERPRSPAPSSRGERETLRSLSPSFLEQRSPLRDVDEISRTPRSLLYRREVRQRLQVAQSLGVGG